MPARDAIRALLARIHFRFFRSRRDFALLRGEELVRLQPLCAGRVSFPSLCNAGLMQTADGYVAVAKNQAFSFAQELRPLAWLRKTPRPEDSGVRELYRIGFDRQWRLRSIERLAVELDGEKADPAIYIEDVRLVPCEGGTFAFANGNGAWPLAGTLDGKVLTLRTVRAPFERPQKNWTPFEHGRRLWLEYSVQPHRILALDAQAAACEEAALCEQAMPGSFDALHGGAPALRLDEHHFLGLANSQHLFWFQDRYYASVFYLFEAKAPWRVVKASRPLRLHSREGRIQYACGMVHDPDRPGHVVVSLGLSDADNVFMRLPLGEILASME